MSDRSNDIAQAVIQLERGDSIIYPTETLDRKSTRLNSSHALISYAVFCLKKKKIIIKLTFLIKHSVEYDPTRETRQGIVLEGFCTWNV